MIERFTRWVSKIAGPNTAHVIDGLVAWELSAGAVALESQSARDYAVAHPWIAGVLTIAPPVLTAAAAKFRKAATKPPEPKG